KVNDDDPRPKWYELHMYPYPSGDLHIGHWYAMAGADVHARVKRMQGYNVLHPMGFDAFGLPAENAAIRDGIHPSIRTLDNISNMRRQLRTMATIYDWDREVITCQPDYYRWNQWFFLQFFRNGLAYRANAPANWCPSCNTVLANEQVIDDGVCERCETPVTRKQLNQWFFRITQYADELLDDSKLMWPEKINIMQKNWIGRSQGVEIGFDISEHGLDQKTLTMFTTRIDTIFGVTFVALAPEHPLVDNLTTPDHAEDVRAYVDQASMQTEVERLSTEKEKTGVFTGAYCVNKLNGDRVPVLVADYVLLTYGTGVVMGVPAHDERDFIFAKTHGLPIRVVVAPPDWDGSDLEEAYIDVGTQVNSGRFDGISSDEAKGKMAEAIEESGWGNRTVQYRMRDWLISRQRYWGTPIPIIYCKVCGTVPVPEEDLPVLLPADAEFRPTGESPLASHQRFVNVACPQCAAPAKRETDTMDTFVDSSWYQFRFASPNFDEGPFNIEAVKAWAPVDQYTGGAEHAVMHLLYARFFTKALRDLGLVDFDEPFIRLFSQGHIIAGQQKMSKSRGNVVSPDQYVSTVGADVVRCYLMFLGPWDQGGEWNEAGFNGMSRWMNRIWELARRNSSDLNDELVGDEAAREVSRVIHKTIRRVTEDVERFKFNTAVAALMEYTNFLNRIWERRSVDSRIWQDAIGKLLVLLAPIAPHISEELWEQTGREYSVHNQSLPEWDPGLAADEMITMVVQVNGRLRDRIEAPIDITEEAAKELALGSERVKSYIEGMAISRVVYVQGKLVNVVAK
ncbi:leucine--tRNA ligase, partial [Dehalococcoidia bacterium]|nr:leucine--tRNA ligase [Dehalococcoidia bacterium]